MATWRVMGQCETGEVCRFCDTSFQTAEEAGDWIEQNEDNYPESILFVEEEENWYDRT